MKTTDLINALATENIGEPRRKLRWRLGASAGVGAIVALALVALLYGFRPDLPDAVLATVLKAGFGLLAAILVLPVLIRLSRPNVRIGSGALFILAFAAASILAAIAHLAFARSIAPLGLGYGPPQCLFRVPVLALPIAAILILPVRSFAPTRLAFAGAAIGAFSAGVAIIPYALFCPMDSIAYVGLWYLGSIALCAALGAALGGRVLRWT